MSYRIHIGIVKKKDLDNHLSKTFTDDDKGWDEENSFFHASRDTELNDWTKIDQFRIVKGYEKEEYPHYILSKEDFQKVLDYYKKFLKESFELKEKSLEKQPLHFHYLKSYFNTLIKQKTNITTSGLFVLDYFYLVRMYENWQNGDVALITHG